MDSSYRVDIFFAKKKDRQLCIYIDYHALSNNMVLDSYPLPHFKELFSQSKGAQKFSRLDLGDGYFICPYC